MSRFLVTGCAGFIGSHLTDYLLAGGHEVVGIDAFTPYYERESKIENLKPGWKPNRFSLHELDLSHDAFEPLLDDADGVFHLAAQPGVRASWGNGFDPYVRHNVLATQRVFDAVLARGLRIVFASSSSIYGDAEAYPTREETVPRPISPYGITKLSCEHLAHAYGARGLDVVCLRYFTVYGPRQRPDMAFARMLRCLTTGATFQVLGNGTQSRDFTFVGDAVAATVAAAECGRPGAIYNVGGGSEATLLDAIRLVEDVAGEPLSIQFGESVAGDARRTSADTSRADEELDWQAATSLEEGLAIQFADAVRHHQIEVADEAMASLNPA
jgi:UDP-glucuronate 4-epimerase